jgi:predicted nuclease of predicted toxin-antitoxin system
MKLLFDENLSFRLVAALADIYPDSSHVREAGLLGADDLRVWNHAAVYGFLLVSKDTDFYERSLVFGAPPKIIWLRIGNCSVNETITLLRSQYIVIRHFAEDAIATFLPLTQSKIAAM